MSPIRAVGDNNRSFLDRGLAIFAPVKPGEGLTALLLMVNVFLLLTAYYIIKPVREALILGEAGAVVKSYAGAAQAVLFLFIVPLYSAVASRVNRVRLINGVTAFFISNLFIFYFLGQMGLSLGIPFFLWVGLFNVMLIAQFWSFANDVYTQDQGKRLFAIIGIGSSLGAIFGAQLAGALFEPLGPYSMMLATAAILAVCMVLTTWVHRRETASAAVSEPAKKEQGRPQASAGGFQLIFRERYLLLIAFLVLISNLVNTTGEFILGKTVEEHAVAAVAAAGNSGLTVGTYIGQFYSDFFFWVNLMGAMLQMFFVSRIMKYLGIGPALFFLPIIALGSYSLLTFFPVLSFIRIAKIAENSTDYSVQNTARHALFLQTSRDAKYKAKAAIDSFFWRAGDALSGLLVFIGTSLAFGVRQFAMVNAAMVVVWLLIAYGIVRLRRETGAEGVKSEAA